MNVDIKRKRKNIIKNIETMMKRKEIVRKVLQINEINMDYMSNNYENRYDNNINNGFIWVASWH